MGGCVADGGMLVVVGQRQKRVAGSTVRLGVVRPGSPPWGHGQCICPGHVWRRGGQYWVTRACVRRIGVHTGMRTVGASRLVVGIMR